VQGIVHNSQTFQDSQNQVFEEEEKVAEEFKEEEKAAHCAEEIRSK
jgi:hypothetical protein